MIVKTYFLEHPNGSVAVADVHPQQISDEATATRLLRTLSARLGGIPALLRCRLGNTFFLHGDEHLYRYGVDPAIETLPATDIDV